MAFIETGEVCSLELYNSYRHERLAERDIEINGLYVYMMRLDDEENLAAMQPARVESIQKASGFAIVQFAFLDEDLTPDHFAEEAIADGIVRVSDSAVFVEFETNHGYPIREAYLRDYFEQQFGEILTESCELALV